MDVLLVLSALALFVGVRTLGLVRARRADHPVVGRRVIVEAVLPPRRTAGLRAETGGGSAQAAVPVPVILPAPAGGVLPTRRSLRLARLEGQAAETSTAAVLAARGADPGPGPDADADAETSWSLPPLPSRAHPAPGVGGVNHTAGATHGGAARPRRARGARAPHPSRA